MSLDLLKERFGGSTSTNKKEVDKKTFSEDDYWKGETPPAQFDNYLNKYGYEYTPPNYPSRY